ncbi:permease [Glycomyces buryatensis]|uniref:Permease n=1 Tax=Glycomyces buryatensis TaxID=2570927 RepID=A0A4S8PT99_9ACTN|nr:permease [Glycomyces buryatensis]THV32872.1 permease [Glycomyces buryatensis]
MATTETASPAATPSRRAMLLGTIGFAAVAVAALAWAKWLPYTERLPAVIDSGTVGTSIVNGEESAPPAPSWRAAVDYAVAYGLAIWPAMVAGLLLAASVEAFLPRRRLLKLFARHRGAAVSTAAGGALSTTSMMCTCCAAPVAASVRKRGVPMSSALAFWLGNPVLNPVVLVFMAVVLPWQFVTVRVVTGVLLVFGVTLLVARLAGARKAVSDPDLLPEDDSAASDEPVSVRDALGRFFKTLGRLSVVLIPEYVVIVLLLGGLRGWLFPAGASEWGVLAVLLFAVVGTLFVIPTAGEIPIIQGLALAGVALGPVGALILTLPALSLPSMLMIRRAFPAAVIAATGASVFALGLAGAGLLVVLS